jgi:hypothetical protein
VPNTIRCTTILGWWALGGGSATILPYLCRAFQAAHGMEGIHTNHKKMKKVLWLFSMQKEILYGEDL